MSLLPRMSPLAAVSLLFCTPITNTVRARCDASANDCHQATWRPVVVHAVSKFPESAVDSAITVRVGRVGNDGRITVLYAFNNPCQVSVTAEARQISDTLDVYFILSRPSGKINDEMSELSACPAAIMNRAYEVTVDQVAPGTHVVRGFNGSASQKTLIASRVVGTP